MTPKTVQQLEQANKLMKMLDIPIGWPAPHLNSGASDYQLVYAIDLYDILTDPIKLKLLLFKLNNPAFL